MGSTQIDLVLTLDEVNGVMVALGNMPYVQIAPLIEKIREQATVQLPVPTPKTAEAVSE
jgi:hypothetical protein